MSRPVGGPDEPRAPHGDELTPLLAEAIVTSVDAGSRCEIARDGGVVVFRGAVAPQTTFYGGDCAAVWSAERRLDLGGAAGLAVRARGDGRTYLVRLRTAETFAGVVHQAAIETVRGAALEVELPFSRFEPVSLASWGVLRGHPPLDPARVTSVGLAVHWQAGPFLLEVESLSVRRALRGAPPPRALDAERWERWLDGALFPMALRAARRPASTTAAEVFAGAAERRADARIPCYEAAAESRCEALLVVRAAATAARRVGSAPSALAAEAVAFLVMEATYELAIAADLVVDALVASGGAPRDWLDREAEAERVFERWQALDEDVADALSAAGLALDPEE